MFYQAIIALAGLFGLVRLFRTTDNFARVILAGQVLAIALTFIPIDTFETMGFVLFILSAILATVYSLIKVDFARSKKIAVLQICIPVVVAHIFTLNRWPYAWVIGWLMLVPVITFLLLPLTNMNRYKDEFAFLTIFAIDAAIRFAMMVEWVTG